MACQQETASRRDLLCRWPWLGSAVERWVNGLGLARFADQGALCVSLGRTPRGRGLEQIPHIGGEAEALWGYDCGSIRSPRPTRWQHRQVLRNLGVALSYLKEIKVTPEQGSEIN